jgi:hypothetical protein
LFETSLRTDGRNTFIAETVDTRGEEYKEIDGKNLNIKRAYFLRRKRKERERDTLRQIT